MSPYGKGAPAAHVPDMAAVLKAVNEVRARRGREPLSDLRQVWLGNRPGAVTLARLVSANHVTPDGAHIVFWDLTFIATPPVLRDWLAAHDGQED